MPSRDTVTVTPTTKPEDLPAYLTIKQAACHTQQSEWAIREAVKQKKLASRCFGSKRIFIPREEFTEPAR